MRVRHHPSRNVPADRIISMTELQKLSLRKLRELRLAESPLVVRDTKRGQGRFVILDHDVYERLLGGGAEASVRASDLADVDFAGFGLLWDRPELTNAQFAALLADGRRSDHLWAWQRALERLPSRVITRVVALPDLRHLIGLVRLRPRLREAWEGAIEFWTAEARSRTA